MTLFDGEAYKVALSKASSVSTSKTTAASVTAMPFWVTRLVKARTSSRFDGIATIPVAGESMQMSWREQ